MSNRHTHLFPSPALGTEIISSGCPPGRPGLGHRVPEAPPLCPWTGRRPRSSALRSAPGAPPWLAARRVHHSCRFAKSSKRSPSSVCRRAPHRLLSGVRATTPRASTARRGRPAGHRSAILHLDGFQVRSVVGLGEPVGLIAVEVDPFNAVGVAAAGCYRIHRRHRCLPGPLIVADHSLTAPQARSAERRGTSAGHVRKPRKDRRRRGRPVTEYTTERISGYSTPLLFF